MLEKGFNRLTYKKVEKLRDLLWLKQSQEQV